MSLRVPRSHLWRLIRGHVRSRSGYACAITVGDEAHSRSTLRKSLSAFWEMPPTRALGDGWLHSEAGSAFHLS